MRLQVESAPQFVESSLIAKKPNPAPPEPQSAPQPPPEVIPSVPAVEMPDVDALAAEAFDKGYAQAKREAADALQTADTDLQTATAAFANGAQHIAGLRKELILRSSDDMLRLVIAVARRVILAEVESKPETILKVIQKALQTAIRSDEFRVRIHPDDLAVATENRPMFVASVSGLQNLVIEADAGIERGGCMVESELGEVDATIDSQLDEIHKHLQNSLDSGQ